MMNYKKIVVACCALFMATTLSAQKELDPELQKQVDQIATTIKSDPSGAAKAYEELLKGKNKKNVSLIAAIGTAYLENDNMQMAIFYRDKGDEVNSRSAELYMLKGDIDLKNKKVGSAGASYQQAMNADKDCFEAYSKFARIYVGVNPQLSVEKLEEYKARHPQDVRVDRELGNAYYQMGKYGNAKTAYDTFMKSGQPNEQDYARYSNLLFLSKDYAESLDMAKQGLTLNPDDHLMKRMLVYNNYELKNYAEGVTAAENFFANPDTTYFSYLDHLYYGRLLFKQNNSAKAIAEFEKALSMDETKAAEILKELSSVYESLQDYANAIVCYNKYLEAAESDDVQDLFMLGRLNYMAASLPETAEQLADTTATGISVVKAGYIAEADTIFAEVAQRVPDSYLGAFWRARVNALADPETTLGLAKPYYEAALAILQANEKSAPANIIECLRYLGYYYVQQGELELSEPYWQKILEIDPNEATAKQAMEWISQSK